MFFNLYGHGKLDLKLVHGRAEKLVGGNKVCLKKVYTSEDENVEAIIEPRVLEKKVRLVTDTFA